MYANCRLGGLFGRVSRNEPLLESNSEPDRQGQCQLSSGCMPGLQHGKEADDTPGWVKELERVTLKVGIANLKQSRHLH